MILVMSWCADFLDTKVNNFGVYQVCMGNFDNEQGVETSESTRTLNPCIACILAVLS